MRTEVIASSDRIGDQVDPGRQESFHAVRVRVGRHRRSSSPRLGRAHGSRISLRPGLGIGQRDDQAVPTVVFDLPDGPVQKGRRREPALRSTRVAAGFFGIAVAMMGLAPIAGSAAGVTPSPQDAASIFPIEGAGWTLDPPTGWLFSPVRMDSSFFHLFGYLGTVPVDPGAICQHTSDSDACNTGGYTLPPGNVLVVACLDDLGRPRCGRLPRLPSAAAPH